jgi:hypothetical protein
VERATIHEVQTFRPGFVSKPKGLSIPSNEATRMLTRCDACKVKLKISETALGKKVRCPKCTVVFVAVVLQAVQPEGASTKASSESSGAVVSSATDSPETQLPQSKTDGPQLSDFFRPLFFADLTIVYGRLIENVDPRTSLPILLARFEQRRTRLQSFFSDLAKVIESTDRAPKRHLPVLVQRFAQWRNDTIKQISGFLEVLPKDDPLNCPISLFGTMDFGRLERAHTKVLAWFLDPAKEHGFGPTILKALLREVEFEHLESVDFLAVEAEAEKLLETGERLDVFVEGVYKNGIQKQEKWYLVIEAKVDAGEGSDQISGYDEWIFNNLESEHVLRIFLTPDRRLPISAKTIGNWKCMSFLDFARIFRHVLSQLRDAEGYHFLRHYLTGVFKDIYHWELPIADPRQCVDPYGFLSYVKAIPH